jgi:hypothetical protein
MVRNSYPESVLFIFCRLLGRRMLGSKIHSWAQIELQESGWMTVNAGFVKFWGFYIQPCRVGELIRQAMKKRALI